MWSRRLGQRVLTFHLAGINNQNFLMRDEETGSFWQQISGRAISGPLRGSQLELIHSDELNFATWRAESPAGTVLAPLANFADRYAKPDWEKKMASTPTVLDYRAPGLEPRTLILGVSAFGQFRAYRKADILREKLILDTIAGHPLLLLVAADNASIRVFSRPQGQDFYRLSPAPDSAILLDEATGRRWNFQGCPAEPASPSECLLPLTAIEDYWFDWRHYHPDTTVFRLPQSESAPRR